MMRRKPPKDWFAKSLIVLTIRGMWVGDGQGEKHGLTREQGLTGVEVDATNAFTSWLTGNLKEKPPVLIIRLARAAIDRTRSIYVGATVEDWRINLDKVVQEFDIHLAMATS